MNKFPPVLVAFFVGIACGPVAAGPFNPYDKGASAVVSNGDRDAAGAGGVFSSVRGTLGRDAGKHCFAYELVTADANASIVMGAGTSQFLLTSYPGASQKSFGVQFINGASQPFVSGVTQVNPHTVSGTATAGEKFTFCFDFSAGHAWIARGSVWLSGDPAAGTAPSVSGITGTWFPAVGTYNAANKARLLVLDSDLTLPAGFEAWGESENPAPPSPVAPQLVWQKNTTPSLLTYSGAQLIERIDVRSYMKVDDGASAQAVRDSLVDFIFPEGRGNYQLSVANDALQVSGGGQAEAWTLSMPNGITSKMFFVPALASGNCLFIWHAGHEQHLITGDMAVLNLASGMLAQGCDMLLLSMPLHGVNAHQTLTVHDDLAQFNNPGVFSALSYFIEPVLRAIDEAASRKTYAKIGMAGLSGGGWTTAVAGALDTRITHLYPVAGSMPFEVDMPVNLIGGLNASSKKGDFEQSTASLYAVASYFDIYALGAQARRAMHFYIAGDNCCFPAFVARSFADQMYDIARDDLGGKLIFRDDLTVSSHQLSPWATATIVRDFPGN